MEPSGLQGNALSVIEAMLRAHVSITGINVMTMDFGPAPAAGTGMLKPVESALQSTHAQLADLYPRYGIELRPEQIWQRMGATVMIGQNDIRGENFTVANAQGLASFASAQHLGRVSMWSVNRDSQCGSAFPQTGLLSSTCSGTPQSNLEFSKVLGGLKGTATATSAAGDVQPAVANTNPADAPYPQWSATADYPSGYKVAEDGEIYQSKWYSTGDDPQTQMQYSWQSAWQLLGPVLPGNHAPATARPATGTYPAWSITTEYHAGARVLYAGLPYQAKWNNQGTTPQSGTSNSSASPWQSLETVPGEPTASASATP